MKLPTKIIEYVNEIRDHDFTDYTRMLTKYPSLDDRQWFEQCLSWVPKTVKKTQAHTTLLGNFKKNISKRIEYDEQEERETKVLFIFVCMYMC